MKKRLMKSLSSMRGFTMIELLVVIAIIGVLAVAVLSAINPLEQINKGKDTRSRSDAAEVLNGVDRYFATQELFPWNKDSEDGATYDAGTNTDPASEFLVDADTEWDWMINLSDVDEVKSQFSARLMTGNEMVLFKGPTATSPVHVCFMPSSKQFQLEAARKCCPTTDAACANDPLAGTQADVTIGGTAIDLCETVDGSLGDNYICLP